MNVVTKVRELGPAASYQLAPICSCLFQASGAVLHHGNAVLDISYRTICNAKDDRSLSVPAAACVNMPFSHVDPLFPGYFTQCFLHFRNLQIPLLSHCLPRFLPAVKKGEISELPIVPIPRHGFQVALGVGSPRALLSSNSPLRCSTCVQGVYVISPPSSWTMASSILSMVAILGYRVSQVSGYQHPAA